MESKEQSAFKLAGYYRKLLTGKGIAVSEPARLNFAYSIDVGNNRDKISLLVYFGKKGNKVVLQGNKELEIYRKVNDLIFGEKLFNEPDAEFSPESYIGTDESGKGDYFGPLVVAGVFIDKSIGGKLTKLGVRDSKTISDWQIKKIAREIKSIAGIGFSTVVISPEKYNHLHKKMGNVNRILGWAHARVLENILTHCKVNDAISDKFGNEKLILDALQEKGQKLNLYQTSKAERFAAVAAAAVIARDIVIRWFEINSRDIGFEIPKGASEIVEETAKKILKQFGEEKLNSMVKLHFKTSGKIFNNKQEL